MTVLYAGSLFGSPPPGVRVLGLGGLGTWLFVPWAGWFDRHRETRF